MPFLNFGDLRRKEVINMRDGARLGCICDLEVLRADTIHSCAGAAAVLWNTAQR